MMRFLFLLLFSLVFAHSEMNSFQREILSPKHKEFIKNHSIIKVSNEKDWAPYDYNENGVAKGYTVDYLKLLGKKIGVTFVFETDNWSNLIKKIKSKEIDIIQPISFNKSRERFLYFTTPILKQDLVLVSSGPSFTISELDALKLKKVGVGKNWSSTKILKEMYPQINFVEFSTSKQKLEALAFGEVDAAVEYYLTVNYIKQKYLLNNLKINGRLTLENFKGSLHIGVRKDWEQFFEIINLAIDHIDDEEILALNNKWLENPSTLRSKKISFTPKELEYLEQKNKIFMCVDPNWMPYEKIENKKHIGIFSDYFKIFRELIPIPIVLVQTQSWTQTLLFAKNRKCDIISSAVKTPKRESYLNFTTPYLDLPLVVATTLDKPFVASLSNVLPYKLAVVKSYAYIEILRNRYPNIKIVEVDSITIGLEKVLSGDVYGFIDSLATVGNRIQQEYFGNLKIAGKIEESFTIGIATRNDSSELLTIFQKAVDNLSQSDHQTILNKWVSVKYDNLSDYSALWKILLLIFVIFIFFLYRQFLLKKQNLMLLQSQKQLQESVEEFEHLISSTIEAVFILEDNKVIDCNNEAIKLFKYNSKDDIVGLSPFTAVEEDFHEQIKMNLAREFSEPYEVNGIKKDGTIFPILIKGHSFIRNNKKIRVTAILDLTELRQKEALLSEHTKMVALGEMLANIAHQWRQPLSVISTAASGVKLQKEMGILNDKIFSDCMDGIVNNANYLSKTIDDFRGFIHQDNTKSNFLLSEHLRKDLTILEGMLKLNDIEVVSDVDPEIRLFNIENELTQAIINIMNNSKDAFDDKKTEQKYIFIKTEINKNRAQIFLRDNAGGIPKDIIGKVFEPYFTTKHKMQGTGLGLYMTNQIITESMEGEIEVKNVEFEYLEKNYRGAEFIITLDL